MTAIIGRADMEGIETGVEGEMGTEWLLVARFRARFGAPDGDPDAGGERNRVCVICGGCCGSCDFTPGCCEGVALKPASVIVDDACAPPKDTDRG